MGNVFVLMAVVVMLAAGPAMGKALDAMDFGAKADSVTDDTAAIQAAMDEAGKTGNEVCLPAGKYLVKGNLTLPKGVKLEGVENAPVYSNPLTGTIILATGGKGSEDGPPLFTLQTSSSVRGLVVYHPEQKVEDIQPYPWTFKLTGEDTTVENVTLINSYNGIRTGPEANVRHRIRSVSGCVLRRGIFIDGCFDVGRIEDVQFHGTWWWPPEVGGNSLIVNKYMLENCEGFIFGKTDSEFVTNTFVFPARIGYHFIATEQGVPYGQFSGISADWSQKSIVVESAHPVGIQITNGMFAALEAENPIQIEITKSCFGTVRFENCAFWGTSIHNVLSHGVGNLSFSNCNFSSWLKSEDPKPLVEAHAGKLQIVGCTFASDHPSVALRSGVKSAIIVGNNGEKGVRIINEIGEKAIITGNEAE